MKGSGKKEGVTFEKEGTVQRLFSNVRDIPFYNAGDERDDLPDQPFLAHHDESNISNGDRAKAGADVSIDEIPMILRGLREPTRSRSDRNDLYQMKFSST
ncbi:hypothetical protein ACJMK2_018566 [Sinanodonta woodiana]|uniref:Uncharacterized protein n=1 Tax=Sinanodonta woodiana TaxID=1069815 RepID=A0ABD3UFU9_SINWO